MKILNKQPIIILTHVLNKAATDGFLPAAINLGYPVYILTDQLIAHQEHFTAPTLKYYPDDIFACDVFNGQAIIELLLQQKIKPAAIFSNSDHIQTACAQAASYFQLPSKNWQVCYRAKNKHAMRQYLAQADLMDNATIWSSGLNNLDELNYLTPPFPCVVKPQQGVASMDVRLCYDEVQLTSFCQKFWHSLPGQALIVEEYLQGELFTLETLGDGKNMIALGGFDVELSAPPHFIETSARWNDDIDSVNKRKAFEIIKNFGINFGVCHSEFILTESGPRLIEINYRSIGDGREFLLNKLADFDWFKQILQLHLGEPLTRKNNIKGEAVVHYSLAENDGRLIKQPDAFENIPPYSINLEHVKKCGDDIKLSHSNKDYLSILTAYSTNNKKNDTSAFSSYVETLIAKLSWEIC